MTRPLVKQYIIGALLDGEDPRNIDGHEADHHLTNADFIDVLKAVGNQSTDDFKYTRDGVCHETQPT